MTSPIGNLSTLGGKQRKIGGSPRKVSVSPYYYRSRTMIVYILVDIRIMHTPFVPIDSICYFASNILLKFCFSIDKEHLGLKEIQGWALLTEDKGLTMN